MPRYSIGLDFGTNSARALVVRLDDGEAVAEAVAPYASGLDGVLLSDKEPDLARQSPADLRNALRRILIESVAAATEQDPGFDPSNVAGIGVDATASTPLPLDANGSPLADDSRFARDLNAQAWLWKDHTAHDEAEEITRRARTSRPAYLERCGGAYSSEWFWAKALRCARSAPEVFDSAHTWMELCDWIPAMLTGNGAAVPRSVCAAGHKGLYSDDWGGYPDEEFLTGLDPRLARLRRSLPERAFPCGMSAGGLTREWAEATQLSAGTPVSVGGIDAHVGAIGSGIKPGTLIRILGTSACDMALAPVTDGLPVIPGISGVVRDSILPGFVGFEAGQAAVGDLFAWWSRLCGVDHAELTERAAALQPGQSGLLALDWNNGNRSVLQDPRLTGLLVGQTLATRPHEVYRALIEATAFGARMIWDRLEEHGVRSQLVINCGGIAEKNPLVLQVYADATRRTMLVSRSSQTCALGAAICGAVAGGAFESFEAALAALTGVKPERYEPDEAAAAVYDELFELYRSLHDAFGSVSSGAPLGAVMKRLLALRDRSR
jgi:L-ribulokinase